MFEIQPLSYEHLCQMVVENLDRLPFYSSWFTIWPQFSNINFQQHIVNNFSDF